MRQIERTIKAVRRLYYMELGKIKEVDVVTGKYTSVQKI
jgi:hypothetical protein